MTNTVAAVFVTKEEYAAWVGVGVAELPHDMARLIQRASELLWYLSFGFIPLQVSTASYDTRVKEATCAQLEYWLEEVGEGVDKVGASGSGSLGSFQWTKAPRMLAPRAARILRFGGYLNRRVMGKGMHYINDQYVEWVEQ
jgi:hypothetical protein